MSNDLTKIRVILDWTPDAKHSIIWAAEKNGLFAHEGLTIEMVPPPSKSSNSLQKIHDLEAELAINYPHNVLLMRGDLPRLISVGALVKKNSEGLLSIKKTEITEPAHIKGKRIGIGPSPVSRSQFEVFLTANGLRYEDIELKYVGFEGEELLLAGEIDALDAVWYAIPRTERKGHEINFIPYTVSGVPDSPFLVFTGENGWVSSNTAALKRFFSCLKAGLSIVSGWGFADWKSYTDTIEGRNTEEEMKIWETTLPLIDDGDTLFRQNINEIEKLQDILFDKNLMQEKYRIGEIFSNEYI